MSMKDDEIQKYERPALNLQSDLESIVFHLQGVAGYENVSPSLELKLKRMKQCRDYINKYMSRIKVIPMIATDFGLSEAQASRIYEDTIDVFNSVAETKGRDLLIDIALGKIFETWTKAMAKQDFRSATSATKQMLYAIKDFYGGNEAKLYEKIQPPKFEFGFFPELTGVELPDNLQEQIASMLKKKKAKDAFIDNVEDANVVEDE